MKISANLFQMETTQKNAFNSKYLQKLNIMSTWPKNLRNKRLIQ